MKKTPAAVLMPKAKFRSITVSEATFNHMNYTWECCKKDYAAKGVFSFSGYITHHLSELIKQDSISAKYPSLIDTISIDNDRILLNDRIKKRIAELAIVKNKLFCYLCNRDNCIHVGFAYSLYQIYEKLNDSQ